MRRIGEMFLMPTGVVPFGALRCDGRYLLKRACPALYSVVGDGYSPEPHVSSDYFRLPWNTMCIQVNGSLPVNANWPVAPAPLRIWIPDEDSDFDQLLDYVTITAPGNIQMTDGTFAWRSQAKAVLPYGMGGVFEVEPTFIRLEFRILSLFRGYFGFSDVAGPHDEADFTAFVHVDENDFDTKINADGEAGGVHTDENVYSIEIDLVENTTTIRCNDTVFHTGPAIDTEEVYLYAYCEGGGDIVDIKLEYHN